MNKREFEKKIKNIIVNIDDYLRWFDSTTGNIDEAITLMGNLSWHFEEHCITPDSWNENVLIQDMLIDFFDNDDSIIEILNLIEDTRGSLRSFIDNLSDDSDKADKWENIYDRLWNVEGRLDIIENDIFSTSSYRQALKELKETLEELI